MNTNNNNSREISNVIRIQGTNDNSILSKSSMIKYGYFQDDFLPFMIGKFSRRAPLINRGYFIRARAIDHILMNFIDNNKHKEAIQIFSLGAGFDTTFFRLNSQGKLTNCTFIELDYFDVAQRKAVLMKQEQQLWNCLIRGNNNNSDGVELNKDNYIVINASNYKLIGIDMTKLDILDACIRASGVSYEVPTLFLSECVITYISAKKSTSLLRFIAKSFNENCFVLYEQIYPDDSFGRFMCAHFKQLGSSLRGIQTYKTKRMQIERFLNAGWDHVDSCDMADFYYNVVSSDEKSRIERLEVFDEYEEWLLKCSHYMVLVACKGMQRGNLGNGMGMSMTVTTAASTPSPTNVNIDPLPLDIVQYITNGTTSDMYKHGGIKAHYVKADLIYATSRRDPQGNRGNTSEYLMRASGYGQNPFTAGHCRLSCVSILDLATNIMIHTEPVRSHLLANSLCGSMTRISDNQFIIFGGRSSPLKPNDLVTRLQLYNNGKDNSNTGCSNISWQAECTELIANNEPDKPSPRWRHMAGCYWIYDKPFLLIYGGRSTNPIPLSDSYIYDIALNSWLQLFPSMPSNSSPGPLCSASVVSVGLESSCSNSSLNRCCGCCCLLIIGGLSDKDLTPSGDIWRWCGRNQQWTRVTIIHGFFPRFSHTSHIVYRSAQCNPTTITLATVGGVSHKTPSCGVALITVDMVTNNARCIDDTQLDTSNESECAMIHNHGSAFSTNSNKIYILGGGGNCFSFGTQLNENVYSIDLSKKDFFK